MNLILLGKPGSGKGTQAELISKKFNIPQVATGEILRNMKKQKTSLARLISSKIDKGQLIPDKLAVEITLKRLSKNDCKKGFLLDGFPRTLNQAKILEKKCSIDKVIYLDVPNELIVKRISNRRECSCGMVYNLLTNPPKKKGICDRCGKKLRIREDDKPEIIRKRLKIYNDKTRPVVQFYRKKGILTKIDGSKPIKKVFSDIIKELK